MVAGLAGMGVVETEERTAAIQEAGLRAVEAVTDARRVAAEEP